MTKKEEIIKEIVDGIFAFCTGAMLLCPVHPDQEFKNHIERIVTFEVDKLIGVE